MSKNINTFSSKIEAMPIPNDVWFAPRESGYYSFEDVRHLSKAENIEQLLSIVDARLQEKLIKPSSRVHDNKDWFLVVLNTCVIIELLGEMFYKTNDKCGGFKAVCNQIHEEFEQDFPFAFEYNLSKMWRENTNIDKVKTVTDLIYTYLNNKLKHEFVAKGVYLDESVMCYQIVNEVDEAYVKLNPSWFYEATINIYNRLFDTASEDPQLRRKFLKYVNRICQ